MQKMDPNFPDIDRDEDAELRIMEVIAGRAAAPLGEEDAFTGENYGSQFLNDSGEGVPEEENGGEGEVPLANSGEV